MNSPATDVVIRCRGLAKTYQEGDLVTPVFEGLDLARAALHGLGDAETRTPTAAHATTLAEYAHSTRSTCGFR